MSARADLEPREGVIRLEDLQAASSRGLDQARVREYLAALDAGEEDLGPISVEEGSNRLIDGAHRTEAYTRYRARYHATPEPMRQAMVPPRTEIPRLWYPEGMLDETDALVTRLFQQVQRRWHAMVILDPGLHRRNPQEQSAVLRKVVQEVIDKDPDVLRFCEEREELLLGRLGAKLSGRS